MEPGSVLLLLQAQSHAPCSMCSLDKADDALKALSHTQTHPVCQTF